MPWGIFAARPRPYSDKKKLTSCKAVTSYHNFYEFGVVMLIYLRHVLDRRIAAGQALDARVVSAAFTEGALLRVRPKVMTVVVVPLSTSISRVAVASDVS